MSDFILSWFKEGQIIPGGSILVDREERQQLMGTGIEHWFLMSIPASVVRQERNQVSEETKKRMAEIMEAGRKEASQQLQHRQMELDREMMDCNCDRCRLERQGSNPFAPEGEMTVFVTMEGDTFPPELEQLFAQERK